MLVHDLATALDVRSRAEFGTGHLEGAICLPLGELERSHGPCQFLDPWRPLILYCQSGARARRAALLLRRQGFRRLLLLGGIASWPYGLIS
ncbi:MAG: rhodanese-like domain-containing protein [Succinivibrionaceae bacterium]|nr:rhodanese-like domain-containing protein [Succinivibrionaceae bacterium]